MSERVVIIGAGISGLACAARLMELGADVLLWEGVGRVGGRISTVREGGVQFEAGPNTLLPAPALMELIRSVGLEDQVVGASPAARRRYVALRGRLRAVPMNPASALVSPLVGPGVLGRVLWDLVGLGRSRPEACTTGDFGSGPGACAGESVASFITRRFGRRALENLAGPFLRGVYAGDPQRLEARSVLRKLVEAEQTHGSVVRGLMAARRGARKGAGGGGPRGSITLRDGLSVLPERIAGLLGPRLRLNTPVESIRREGEGWRVVPAGSGGGGLAAGRVVIATEAPAAAALIGALPGAGRAAGALGSIPTASLVVAGLVYDRGAVGHPLDGFGYLAGPGHDGPGPGGSVLGCIFRSAVFPHTAPGGKALLTAILGGVGDPGCVDLDDGAIVDLAHAELAERLGISARPEGVILRRWAGAIPQPEVGHAEKVRLVREWSEASGVPVIVNAVSGVSMPDCIAGGFAAAERIVLPASVLPGAAGLVVDGGPESGPLHPSRSSGEGMATTAGVDVAGGAVRPESGVFGREEVSR